MKNNPIDVDLMRSVLDYDPDTGILTWKEREANSKEDKIFNSRWANKRAGSCGACKKRPHYTTRRLCFSRNGKKKKFMEHRVIWCIYYGSDIPEGMQIDHVNGDSCDNRINNLRLVNNADNAKNQSIRYNSTSGVLGVNFSKREQRWKARIMVNRRAIYLGTFTNKEDAIEARKKAEIDYGFHENHGREKHND